MTRRLPQIAFALLALATIGAFFLVQALKTQSPLVWAVPIPVPAAINPVHGRVCNSAPTEAHRYGVPLNHRRTQITISLSHADTVGIYIVSAKNPAGNTVATVSSGTPMRASPRQGEYPRTFTWNGRLQDGRPAPDGLYYFRLVLEHQGRSANFSQNPVEVIRRPPPVRILSVRLIEPPGRTGTGTATGTGSGTGTRRGNGTGAGGAGTGRVTATGTTGDGTRTVSGTTTGAGSGTTTGAGSDGRVLLVNGPAVLSPPHGRVRITFTPGIYRRATIDIYRTDVSGGPELVDTFPVRRLGRDWINWDGQIAHAPAPAGTYLVGITADDLACNKAVWPRLPVTPGATPHAGVTVSYLSVRPPVTPTFSGGRASVAVSSTGAGFTWRLRLAGGAKVLARGSGPAGLSEIHVRMPRHRAGLYTLTVQAGPQSAAVPLVASRAGAAAARARVLVVLPMLTWMGDSPVDDSGDGLPDTLAAEEAVSLARPLVDGPPAGFGEDTALLTYLTAHDLSYQLTTDVALAQGVGPSLADRGGVIVPAGENFLPAGLGTILRGFVRGGGRVLALGTSTFSGTSHITGFPAAPRAGAPRPTATDPFGAGRGPVTPTGGELISSVSADALGLFHDAGEFGGFSQYQPIRPPAGTASGTDSALGIGSAAPAIVGFHDGSGSVVEVGLSGFAASLAHNPDSASLLNNVWQLLSQ